MNIEIKAVLITGDLNKEMIEAFTVKHFNGEKYTCIIDTDKISAISHINSYDFNMRYGNRKEAYTVQLVLDTVSIYLITFKKSEFDNLINKRKPQRR